MPYLDRARCQLTIRERMMKLFAGDCPRSFGRDVQIPLLASGPSYEDLTNVGVTEALQAAGRVPLEVRVERDGHAVVVQLFGEFDAEGCALFRRRLASARRRACPWVVVDLSGLDAIDISGMRALMRLREEEPRLLLLRPPLSVRQTLAAHELYDALPFVD